MAKKVRKYQVPSPYRNSNSVKARVQVVDPDRDTRVRIKAEPEDAMRALLNTPRDPEKRRAGK